MFLIFNVYPGTQLLATQPAMHARTRALDVALTAAAAYLYCDASFNRESLPTGTPSTVVVDAPAGVVTGLREGAADSFRGIRYGQPPTGKLRFLPSLPFKYTRASASSGGGGGGGGGIDATRYGPRCFQASSPMLPPAGFAYSEDCLVLNVWRPTAAAAATARGGATTGALRPVLLWIHGGGFTQGTGNDPLFEGSRLAVATNSIVVTINYRQVGWCGVAGWVVVSAWLVCVRWCRLGCCQWCAQWRRPTTVGCTVPGQFHRANPMRMRGGDRVP